MPTPVPLSKLSRILGIVLALVAASGFALSVQAGAWWSMSGVEIGPHGTRHCMGGADACGLQWLGGTESWMRMGVATWGAGLVAIGTLILLAGGLAAKRTPTLIAGMVIVSALTAAVTGAIFLSGFPGFAGAHVDRGLWLYAIGVFLGLAAALTVLRAARIAARAPRTAGSRPVPQP